MFRITSFSTPISPLSALVSRPHKSALTPANNSLANASGVPHQRQGAKVGTNRGETQAMLETLFRFMGAGLPLTSEGRFNLQHVIEVARQNAEISNPTVSKLWRAVAKLIDPLNHPDVMIKIHRDKNTGELKIFKNFNRDDIATLENFRNSSHNIDPHSSPTGRYQDLSISGIFQRNVGCILPRGAKRTEHLKGLNGFLAFLEDYQAYLDSLKTESTPS